MRVRVRVRDRGGRLGDARVARARVGTLVEARASEGLVLVVGLLEGGRGSLSGSRRLPGSSGRVLHLHARVLADGVNLKTTTSSVGDRVDMHGAVERKRGGLALSEFARGSPRLTDPSSEWR